MFFYDLSRVKGINLLMFGLFFAAYRPGHHHLRWLFPVRFFFDSMR